MQITREIRGAVTVLHLEGKITLGEGDELLKDCVHQLIAVGRMSVVLDLHEVPYIDSAGNGEIVRTYTTLSRQGGRLVLCNLTKRILDLYAITKLLTVFEIYESVDEAVQSFGVTRFEVSCPVCRPPCWTAYRERTPLLSCDVCDVRFRPRVTSELLSPLESADTAPERAVVTAHVSHLWWITYYENAYGRESVQLTFGRPSTVAITGRLDLFAFDIVHMAWRALPMPRRAIFDTTGVRVFSEAGRAKLEQLCAVPDQASRAAIVARAPDTAARIPNGLPVGPSTFVHREDAVATLGDLQYSPQAIDVRIRRRA